MRRFLAALFTLAGAVGVVVATLRPWQGERTATDLALRDLFNSGDDAGATSLVTSLALPLLTGALLGLLGMLVRARAALVLAFLACLVPTGLWAIQASVGMFDIPDLRSGFTNAGGATVAFLLAVLLLPGRKNAPAASPAGAASKGRWPLRKTD